MKTIMRICIVLAILLIPTNIWAQEDTTNVVISFNLTAQDKFIYEVKVSKGGSLYDGSQKITNGIITYELSVGEKKKFKIEAEKGYEVKEIKVNNRSVATDIEEVVITGVSKKSSLEIQYEKIKNGVEPPNITNSNNENGVDTSQHQRDTSNPKTGDWIQMNGYICLMFIVMYGACTCIYGKSINTMECVDNSRILKQKNEEEMKNEE